MYFFYTSKVVLWKSAWLLVGTSIQALMHKQGETFQDGVYLAYYLFWF